MEPRNTCDTRQSEAKAYAGQAQTIGVNAAGSLRVPSKQEQDIRERLWRKRSELMQQLSEVDSALEQLNDKTVQAVLNVFSVASY